MNILVVSDSIIINKLLSLTFDKNGFDSEIVNDINKASSKDYNLIFVDDIMGDLSDIISQIKKEFDFSKLILISNQKELEVISDYLLNKPFQGRDVQELLDGIDLSYDLIFDDEDEDDIDKEDSLVEVDSLIESQKSSKTNILDPNEIDRIKALMALEANEDEILGDDISFVDKMRAKESLRLKSKNSKKLIKELAILNKKELKKLLKGAKIRIRIDYE